MDAAEQNGYKSRYTIEDIYSLPEGKRAELIDGELYLMAAPGMMHQRLVMKLSYEIEDYIRHHHGLCEVFPSPFAVFLNADDEIYVEPDISVICDRSRLTDRGCSGAPDWIIEIVSPGSKSRDYIKKMIKYNMAGVREYWIADYEKRLVMVYDFEHDSVENYSFSDKVQSGILKGLVIDFSKISME